MSLSLRSSSNLFNENERLRRQRLTTTTTLNRFLSFNDNKSSAAENRRRLLQSEPNLIELLEEDEDDIDEQQASCHECNACSKVFASEYGLNYHISMHHPNQSILCSVCHITFRSHRSLKTHQHRRHPAQQSKPSTKHSSLPNYSHISSYLVLAFSSNQFPIVAKAACEQRRLPLGEFSAKLYQCQRCFLSFPCSRTLKHHVLNAHEQYEYRICEELLSNLIEAVEFSLRTVTDEADDLESIKYHLAQQASQFGLVNKQLANKIQTNKHEQEQSVYPFCQHENRTCANLCLKHLSAYSQLTKNYSYSIATLPKGNVFAQGSIVSVPSMNTLYSLNSFKANEVNGSNELTNGRQKRKNSKQIEDIPSPQFKRKSLSNVASTSRSNRTSSNNRISVGKQQVEATAKINDSKSISNDQPSSAQRRLLPKDNYIRSSSISSNSSTSTRSSLTKSSSSSATLISQRSSKRSLSPSIPNSLEKTAQKRRRRRRRRNLKPPSPLSVSPVVIPIDDQPDEIDIEQENGEDDEEGADRADQLASDVIPIKSEKSKSRRSSKQRQASSGSIEYVQALNIDQQLNNIENFESNSPINDEEIILCRSPPSARKTVPSPTKQPVNGSKKSNGQQSPGNDEQVRVRCKICGEILEGRSRFSKHVMAMHSTLLKKNISDSKPQPTAIVR